MPEEENSWDNWDMTSQLSGRDVMSYFLSITPHPAMGGSRAPVVSNAPLESAPNLRNSHLNHVDSIFSTGMERGDNRDNYNG